MKILFLSYLNSRVLASTAISLKKYDKIFYFDISRSALFFLESFKLDRRIKHFNFNLAELKEKGNESSIPRIFGENLINLCDEIEDGFFKKSRLIYAFTEIFGQEKIKSFFRKIADMEIKEILVRINAVKWYRENRLKDDSAIIEFCVEEIPPFSVIKGFSRREYSISLFSHFSLRKRVRNLCLILRNSAFLTCTFFVSLLNPWSRRASVAKLGIPHERYGVINFDLVNRCAFPWLFSSRIQHQRIMIYFNSKHYPATEEIVDKLRASGVDYIAAARKAALTKNIPIHKTSARAAKEILRISRRLLFPVLRELLALRFSTLCYVDKMLYFVNEYSRASDFYFTNNIKINVDQDDYNPYSIARQAALRDTGGINISHQISNWVVPAVSYGSCSNILFLFGPHYYSIIKKSGSQNDAIIYFGFWSDYSFKTVKENSAKIRKDLLDNGAKFIICYFDEGSSEKRISPFTNSKSQYVYKKFLDWVLSDDKLGLICNPKKPALLFKANPEITDLIGRAKATGRCIFMEGKHKTYNWPTEAAQASDIAVGSLIGGTTVLESLLSGVRAVYLDTEALYSFPEYKRGKDKIVFDDVNNLILAIDKYRRGGLDGLGDISLVRDLVDRKDPFRDGRAAERMGQYIKWLLDSFSEGKSGQEAISSANDKYASAWKEENVVSAR